MTDKFHINNMGNPGKCAATKGGCPFGGESEHFDSEDAARTNFERAKTEQLFAPLKKTLASSSVTDNETKKTPRPLKELSALARDSRDSEILTEAAEFGSARTLGNLASNRDAPTEALVKAFERTDSDAVRLKLQANENFPVGLMNAEGIKKLYYSNPLKFEKRMVDDTITDSQADVIIRDYAYYGADKILSNPNNQISTEKLIEIAESDVTYLRTVIRNNPKYPLSERFDHLSTDQRVTVARHTDDSDVIRKLHEVSKDHADESKIDDSIVSNQSTPTDVLDKIGEKDASITLRQDYLFHHRNSSPQLKDKIRSLDPTRFN